VFTHRDLTADVFRVDVAGPTPASDDARWIAPAMLGTLGTSTFTRKTVAVGLGTKYDTRALRA
jgi:hypothetical protein